MNSGKKVVVLTVGTNAFAKGTYLLIIYTMETGIYFAATLSLQASELFCIKSLIHYKILKRSGGKYIKHDVRLFTISENFHERFFISAAYL